MWSRSLWSVFTDTRTRVTAFASIVLMFAMVLAIAEDDVRSNDVAKQVDPKVDTAKKSETAPPPPEKKGVLLNDSRAFPGYNLINPGRKQTYLYDNEGRVVHTWTSEYSSGAAAYLLDNGHLFRPTEAANRKKGFQGPAAGGRIQEFDWEGNLVWDFEYHSEKRLPHHDAIKLPNGNALLICWEWIDEKEAVAAGRRPETVKDTHLQPDCLVEIKPTGKTTGEVVWEWRSWDHLIQDYDTTKANYGNVSEHPELFDLNYIRGELIPVVKPTATEEKKDPTKDEVPKEDASKAPSQDVPKVPTTPVRKNPDWMHVNAVAYNAELDQIALSSPNFDEIWIIDHSPTTEEAKGHTGGRRGKGGDILYRWGNPRVYRHGTSLDQRLFFQHNIQWIPKGLNGEGHLLVFNNGSGRKPEEFSEVYEFVPPTDSNGNYIRTRTGVYGPDQPLWSYSAPDKKDFFSWFISGAQRLPNGNTLINAGAMGIVFEVTSEKETVWKFSNPLKPVASGQPAAAPPPKRFEVLSSDARNMLGMTEEQRKNMGEIDNELIAKLEKILAAEQMKIVAESNPSDNANFSKAPRGEYLTVFNRSTLNLTDAQRTEIQALQNAFNPKISSILTDAQKTLVADFKKGQIAAAEAAARATPRRPGNTLFRATRYALSHPAFAGRTLTPGKTLLDIEEEFDKQKAEATATAKANAASASKETK